MCDVLQPYKTALIPARFKSTPGILTIAALAAGLAFAGCKSRQVAPPVAPINAPPRGPVDEPTKTLPHDLPPQMPIYPGVRVDHVRKPRGAMRELILSTPGDLNPLVGFFKNGLKDNGFHITSSLIMPARRTWSCDFQKGGRPGSILLYPSDADKSRMTIDLIYEMPPSKADEAFMEPIENFDVEGPGEFASAQTKNPQKKRN
jgi:hypothetical protein